MGGVIYHSRDAKERLSHAKGVVWDLDNTLYRVDKILEEHFHLSVARAVVAAGIKMSLEEAQDMARLSSEKYGQNAQIFIDRYGLNIRSVHEEYHDYSDEKLIKANEEICNLFAQQNLQHALVTHASRGWANRVLAHLGLTRWIKPENVFGLENFDFQAKYEHSAGFDRALKSLDMKAGETLMIEDSLRNLQIPHKMGMATVLIHHGQKPEIPPGFLDMSCANAVDFMTVLNETR